MVRVLIIDDDELVRVSIRKLLEIKGFEVLVATSGNRGLDVLRGEAESIDLLITDIFMTDIDGFEVIQDVRRDYPDIKIIALSGGGLVDKDSVLQSAKGLGAHQCLTKPLSSKELFRIVMELTEGLREE